MRKQFTKILLAAGLVMICAGLAQAAGFNIYEAGVKATALGGAFTATADDGSAMFYNAAGLSFQAGPSVSLNVMPISPRFKFQGASDVNGPGEYAEAASNTFLVPGLYYANNPGKKLSYGLGVYAPFGLGVEWQNPETFVGRQVSYDVSIQTVYVTPAVSYMVAEGLALAVGLDVAHQNLELNKFSLNPTSGANALDTKIEGSSSLNVTPSVGLMYRPDEKLSLGVMYHHKKTMDFEDQDATLANVDPGTEANPSWSDQLLAGLGGSDQTISSAVNLPYILSFGAAYQLSPRLKGEVNYVRFGWGVFEKLEMDFTNDALDQTIVFDYEDTWQVRLGVNYEAVPEKLNLLAGFVHDKTPQPIAAVSPLLPDSDRNDYSFGFQYHSGDWDFTGCYMAVIGDERTNIVNGQPANHDPAYPVGTYKSIANIFGAGIGYRF